MLEAVMGAHVVTVNEVLEGHVALDIQCLDRIYLNAYVMKLQTSAQVVAFLSGHLGFPFPSPALFTKIGERFRRAVTSYAETNDIPWIKFGKDDDKLATMAPYLRRQAATGCSGVAAIGGGAGVSTGLVGHRGPDVHGHAAVVVLQGRPARHRVLLLSLGRRLRPGVHQAVCLLP